MLKGGLRELLDLHEHPAYDRELPTYSLLSFNTCDKAFRDNLSFTSYAYNDMPGVRALGEVILNKIGDEHRRLRATA